ncbi:MAG: class I SAM-dependent methyltransferase [Nitrospirae bacterium]|nr:class I SAM-dependent methyltransferase [Nitrospirota bacterium]
MKARPRRGPSRGLENTRACYLCGHRDLRLRHKGVRDRGDVDVFECAACGLVALSSFDHIEEGFYENGAMHDDPVDGIEDILRMTAADDKRRYEFCEQLLQNKAVLDFGCGSGGFVALARQSAQLAEGLEIEKGWKAHHRKRGIHVYSSLSEVKRRYDFITLFHVLEHLPDPRETLGNLSRFLAPGGQVILEVPSPNDALYTLYRSRAFADFGYWGCHLYLFTSENLRVLSTQAGFRLAFLKQVQRYPLSNHLYWLARGMKGGHMIWSFLDSPALNAAYEAQLASLGLCDTLMAGLERV